MTNEGHLWLRVRLPLLCGFVGCVLAMACIELAKRAFPRLGTQGSIVAREFRLVDDSGRHRLDLAFNKKGTPGLHIWDRDGHQVLGVGGDERGASIGGTRTDATGDRFVDFMIGRSDEGQFLTLGNLEDQTKGSIGLVRSDEDVRLFIHKGGEEDKSAIVLGFFNAKDEQFAGLEIGDAEGYVRQRVPSGPSSVIRARRFVVIGDSDRDVRAVWNSHSLSFSNKKSKGYVRLTADPFPSLVLANRSQSAEDENSLTDNWDGHLSLSPGWLTLSERGSVAPDSAQVKLTGGEYPRLEITAARGTATLKEDELAIHDKDWNKQIQVGISTIDPAPEIRFSWDHKTRLTLGLSHKGSPSLAFWRPPKSDDDFSEFSVRLDDTPALRLFDAMGQLRGVFGKASLQVMSTGEIRELPASSLVLYDASGKVIEELP